jgi:hypothetical protein
MSDLVGSDIFYKPPASEANARAVLEALRDAVEANWERFADPWSSAEPYRRVEVEAWLDALADPERFSFEQEFDEPERFIGWEMAETHRPIHFDFDFSPTSCYIMTLEVRYHTDGQFSVSVYAQETAFTESRSYRAQIRRTHELGLRSTSHLPDAEDKRIWKEVQASRLSPDVGVQNWRCLLAITDALLGALPAWWAEIDERARKAWGNHSR